MTIACMFTVSGLLASMFGVWLHQPALLLIGLAFDAVDGRVARALNEATDFGGRLDWYTDVLIAQLLLWSTNQLWAVPPLMVWHCYARGESIRFSGRAIITVIVCLAWAGGYW